MEGDIFEAPEDADTSIVEPNIDPAKPVERLGGQILDLILLRRVGLNDQGVAAEIQTFPLHFAQHIHTPGSENHGGSLFGEGMSRRAANAAGGAGDHDDGIIGV